MMVQGLDYEGRWRAANCSITHFEFEIIDLAEILDGRNEDHQRIAGQEFIANKIISVCYIAKI